MTCTIVVGGQYGSEGKGKVVALEAIRKPSPWVVRCGGPNSGHTINVNGQETVLRQIPAGAGHPNCRLFLSAGCVIDEALFVQEVTLLGIERSRVVVDPRAVLLAKSDPETELPKVRVIGSTASGTGAALMRRMAREPEVRLADSSQLLREYATVDHVAPLLHTHLDRGGDVIIEGTQGFGLSLLHGPYYPFVTSRDTTAAGFASEVGLSPRQVDSVVVVIRTFPIRVGGNSGPLYKEVSWDFIAQASGAPVVVPELTSVTRRLRRVGLFNLDEVRTACMYNRPTSLAIMGIDRLDYANYNAQSPDDLSELAWQFIEEVENGTGVPIEWVGTGFSSFSAINLLEWRELAHARSRTLEIAQA